MPGVVEAAKFSHITITKLHPTFGAEISGVDFSRTIEAEVFQEILTAINKVSRSSGNVQQN